MMETILHSSPGSRSAINFNNSISDWACTVNGFRDFIILMATSVCELPKSYAQNTCPNEPYTNTLLINKLKKSYLVIQT
jgi:hypothetical protein